MDEINKIRELYKLAKENNIEENINNIYAFNQKYINEFEEYLKNNKLKDNTIKKHVENVEFFLNSYLLHEFKYNIFDSIDSLNDFFSYFFIHKYAFSSVANMKEFISSLKHFYKYMYQYKYINSEANDFANFLFKDEKDNWIEKMKEYDK